MPLASSKRNRRRTAAILEGTTIVQTREEAQEVLPILLDLPLAAYDTETTGVDPSKESPVGKGEIICFSVFAGEDIDWGNGPNLWVDTLENPDVLFEFEEWLSSEENLKLGHNLGGFDRHVTDNHGIEFRGWGGDTVHMMRLLDSGRKKNSLEMITSDLLGDRKIPMKEKFGKPKLKKDGTPGKEIFVPSTVELQTNPETRDGWIEYSVFDANSLWRVHQKIRGELDRMPWAGNKTMLDFYEEIWFELGWELSNMEKRGFTIAVDYLFEIEPVARGDQAELEGRFKAWASGFCPDAIHMNLGSDKQIQTFLFGGFVREDGEPLYEEREFKVDNTEGWINPKTGRHNKKRPITLNSLGLEVQTDELTDAGWPAVSGAILERLAFQDADEYRNQISKGASRKEAFKKAGPGRVFEHLGGGNKGRQACLAIFDLAEYSRIGTLLSNFIGPLQTLVDKRNRVHTAINLNTESGRLSSRRPNAQNQPALEKDRYYIRDAWTVGVPNPWDGTNYPDYDPEDEMELIVADYGQLELRILAHMSNCKSMIEAFEAGGDFHSRTALGMFDYIAEAVENGECSLEKNPDGIPTIKDMFGSERRKGKTMNFSIAYGKTKYGFAKDWNTTVGEAQEYLDRWYESRPEVKEWQQHVISEAFETGFTRTLMGRYRPLPDLYNKRTRSRAKRKAINTPVQGGAADIVNMAMVKLCASEALWRTGFRLILQVHDELVFEGPRKNGDRADSLIRKIMSHPFKKSLRVELPVDSNREVTWYLAK